MMPTVTLEDLLEAGVHFGHQTYRWHPKMENFIFGERAGIHLIDLKQTLYALLEAYEVIRRTAADSGSILFVGTKKQAKEIVKEEAERCGMFFVTERWLGGMLTNFRTIRSSVDRMNQIDKSLQDGTFDLLTKKERIEQEKAYKKLNSVLGGVRDMDRLPNILFVIDAKKEKIPVREAKKLNIPVVAMCDTNTDPESVEYAIPSNDDAIKSIRLITHTIADAVRDGLSGGQLLERIDEESRAAQVEETPEEDKTEKDKPKKKKKKKKSKSEDTTEEESPSDEEE